MNTGCRRVWLPLKISDLSDVRPHSKTALSVHYVGPMVNVSSKLAMNLKFYQVIWTLRSFLGIQIIVTLLILFSVLYLYVWRKSSLTDEMSTDVRFE